MKKAAYILFVVVVFCLFWWGGRWGGRLGYDFVKDLVSPKPARSIPKFSVVDLGGKTSVMVPGDVADFPLDYPPAVRAAFLNSRSYQSKGDETIPIMINTGTLKPGFPFALDAAAEGALFMMRANPNTAGFDSKKRNTEILGARAIEIDAEIKTKDGKAMSYRGVVCVMGDFYFLISCIGSSAEGSLQSVWRDILKSIVREGPAPETTPAGLPAGMSKAPKASAPVEQK